MDTEKTEAEITETEVNEIEAELNGTDTADVQTETPTEKATEVAAQKPDEKVWDTERQRADQAEANFRKAHQERSELAEKVKVESEAREALQKKLDEFAKANDVDLETIDPELTDPTILKALKSMKGQVDRANQKVADLEKSRLDAETARAKQEASAASDKVKAEIISDIESDLGVGTQFRNQALKAADEFCVKRGYSPTDRYEAAKILRNAYKQVSAKPASGKTATPSDTGTATVAAKPKEEIKPGTLREVAAQLRAKVGLG